MSRSFRSLLIAAALPLALGCSTSAFAEQYDANCNPVPREEERLDMEIAKSWLPIGLGLQLADKFCQGHNFIKKLLTRQPDPEKVTSEDVFEAAKPEVPAKLATSPAFKREADAAERLRREQEQAEAARRNTNAADEAVAEANRRDEEARLNGTPPGGEPAPQTGLAASIMGRDQAPAPKADPVPEGPVLPGEANEGENRMVVLPPEKQGGFIAIFEGKVQPNADGTLPDEAKEIHGEGVKIAPDGIEAGHFEDGKLDGQGQEVAPDGAWRGGDYRNGEIEGPGWEVREENGKVYTVDANFRDDKPDGQVRLTFEDGSSRYDLWQGGKRIAEGELAREGMEPAPAVYKSPEQLAAEQEAAYEASLDKAPSAGALYALADEAISSGKEDRGRAAFRKLMTRFPDSPFALKAADRLAGNMGGAPASTPASAPPRPAPASSASSRPSTAAKPRWPSVCRRNAEKIMDYLNRTGGADGGIQVKQAFINMWAPCRDFDPESKSAYDQNVQDLENFRKWNYQDTRPEKTPGLMAEINRALSDPNYSTEYGTAATGPMAAQAPQQAAAAQCSMSAPAAASAFNDEFGQFTSRYPVNSSWGSRATYQYSMFLGEQGLRILAKYKACMSPDAYTANYNALRGAQTQGQAGCEALSSSAGSCVAAYPGASGLAPQRRRFGKRAPEQALLGAPPVLAPRRIAA